MMRKTITMPAMLLRLVVVGVGMMGFLALPATAQLPVPRYDSFNDGFPVDWVRAEPSDSVRWEATAEFGWYGTPGMMVDLGHESNSAEAWMQTPLLNLTTVDNPVLRFKVAQIKNNFLAPILSLWYNDGDGWKRLHGWGQPTFSDDNEEIESTENFFPTLSHDNIRWVDVTFPLDEVADRSAIRFEFRAEMVNGGWLLLDEVSIDAGETNGIEEEGESFWLNLR